MKKEDWKTGEIEMTKSKVFFDVVASIDGFVAPEGMDLAHANDPEYKHWLSQC